MMRLPRLLVTTADRSTIVRIYIFDVAARCAARMMRMASVDLGFCWFAVAGTWENEAASSELLKTRMGCC
ncbi:hypothetical protein ACLOJK_009081 [Asimina triloba]